MTEQLSSQAISDAVGPHGWRVLLGGLSTAVRAGSLLQAADIAREVVRAGGPRGAERLAVDIRPGRVEITLLPRDGQEPGADDADLAQRISAVLVGAGVRTDPEVGTGAERAVQVIEVGVDALDIPAVRPFWKAVLGYVDYAGEEGPAAALMDPLGQGPPLWFQQMDAPRPQRNRLHFDVTVPHDEARRRVEAALAAGGRLVTDVHAPAFWVLADPEGNEACVCTWQGRD